MCAMMENWCGGAKADKNKNDNIEAHFRQEREAENFVHNELGLGRDF